MTDRGEPVRISRFDLEQLQYEIRETNRKAGIAPKIPLISTPDHVLESRGDCAVTFLEEGLFPLIRDGLRELTTKEVTEIAKEFITKFHNEHPNDFDLTDPVDLISIASAKTFGLSIIYAAKHKVSGLIADEQIENIVNRTDDLLGNVLEDYFGTLDNTAEE